jgi:hypothetical protein
MSWEEVEKPPSGVVIDRTPARVVNNQNKLEITKKWMRF